METSNGLDGIYTKNQNGCWAVSGNSVTISKEKSSILARLRRLLGNNAVKPKN